MRVLVTLRSAEGLAGRSTTGRPWKGQFAAFGVLLALWALPLSSLQAAPGLQEAVSERSPRVLSRSEGKAILDAAWDHRQQVLRKPDCSHLVNEVYRLAGFAYPYATSFELYAGHPNFARVRTPHAGDIIVWPGHAGIVVNPREHTFYSSVSSGLRTETYDGGYWRSQGRPRFYRYVMRSGVLLARNVTPSTRQAGRDGAEKVQVLTVPVIEGSEDNSSPRGSTVSGSADSEDAGAGDATELSAFEVPSSIPIITRRAQPTQEEVSEAISELSSASGNVLRRRDLSKSPAEVAIFDQFRVERVQIKRDRGWAQVRVESRITLKGAKIEQKHHTTKLRWELRRRERGWLALTPTDRNYVPRDVAIRVTAAQLAALTQSELPSSQTPDVVQQEAQLVHVLDALFQNK